MSSNLAIGHVKRVIELGAERKTAMSSKSCNVVTHPGDIAALKTIWENSEHDSVDLDFNAAEGVCVDAGSFIITRKGRLIKLNLSEFYDLKQAAYQALAGLEALMELCVPGVGEGCVPGLEFLVGLKYLQLLDLKEDWRSDGEVATLDLAPLRGLISLRELSIDGLIIKDSDLSPLAGLTELRELKLAESCSSVFDLRPLAGLNKLRVLDLGGNKVVKDLAPLAGLRRLQTVDLVNSDIEDLSPLAGLYFLRQLNLYGNRISDIGPLSGLRNLRLLDLGGNQISDIKALAELTVINHLYLSGNDIDDLSPLSGLINLTELRLDGNRIVDVSPLTGMDLLRELNLANNEISDLPPLSGLPALTILDISGNTIAGYQTLLDTLDGRYLPIFSLTVDGKSFPPELKERLEEDRVNLLISIETLTVTADDCPDGILHVADNPNLYVIDANNAGLERVVLSNLPTLKKLNFPGNRISDLEAMLKDLGTDDRMEMALDLGDNQISDMRPLGGLPNVSDLNLAGNKIESLDGLPVFHSEAYLNLSDNLISDLSPLLKEEYAVSLSRLSVLYLQGNPINDYTPLLEIAWGTPMKIVVNEDFPAELKERLEDKRVRVCFPGQEDDDEDCDADE